MISTFSRRISKLKFSMKRSKIMSQASRYQDLYSDPKFLYFLEILQVSGNFPLELHSLIIANIVQTFSLRQLIELIGIAPGIDYLIAQCISNTKLYTYDGDSMGNSGLQLEYTEASCGQKFDEPLTRSQLETLSEFVNEKGIHLKSIEILSFLLGSTSYIKYGDSITRSCPAPESFLSLLDNTISIKTSGEQLIADDGKVLPRLHSLTELSLTIDTLLDFSQLHQIISSLKYLKNLTVLNFHFNRVGYSSESAKIIAKFAKSNPKLKIKFYHVNNEQAQSLNPSDKIFNDLSPIKGMFKTLKSSMRLMDLQWTSMFQNLTNLELNGPCDNAQALQRIKASKIQKLTVRLNDFSIDSPLNFDLSTLTQLKILNFSNCQIYEDTFSGLPKNVHTLGLDSCEVSDHLMIPNDVINLTVGPLVPNIKCYSDRVKLLKIRLSCFAIENESLNTLNPIFEFISDIEFNLVGFVKCGPIKLTKTIQSSSNEFPCITIQNFLAEKSNIPYDNEVLFKPNCSIEVQGNFQVNYRELFIAGYLTCLEVLQLKSAIETDFASSVCINLFKEAFKKFKKFGNVNKITIAEMGNQSKLLATNSPIN